MATSLIIMPDPLFPEIACFISPHGFGHATRTIAILEALQTTKPDLRIHLITTVPETLFQSTSLHYRYHPVTVDVGLLQKDSFTFDIPGTVTALKQFIPFEKRELERLKKICKSSVFILSDISILGIYVAKICSIPAVLVENFTWDWIYAHFNQAPELQSFVPIFKEFYAQADFHIQAEPVCLKTPCDLRCQPISRKLRSVPDELRQTPNNGTRNIVLVTTGGISTELPFIHLLSGYEHYYFILAGQKENIQINNNIYALAYNTKLYHPDLINSSDLVICKSGYSTIAECCQSAASIACVHRAEFPESVALEQFVRKNLAGVIYDQQQFFTGQWLGDLPQLLKRRAAPYPINGAGEAAALMATLF
jgi:UDP:flavonoid glycosyltransferase YjiC (YdhE family)